MTNYDLEEDSLLRLQVLLSLVFIFTLILSISLSYNAMMKFEKKKKIYTDDDADKVLKINRAIALMVAIGFLLINLYDKSLKEKYGFKTGTADKQIIASLLTVASSIIVLLIAFSNNNSFTSQENPEI